MGGISIPQCPRCKRKMYVTNRKGRHRELVCQKSHIHYAYGRLFTDRLAFSIAADLTVRKRPGRPRKPKVFLATAPQQGWGAPDLNIVLIQNLMRRELNYRKEL